MARQVIGKCPVCGHGLKVSRLKCNHCDSALEGNFELCKFCKLSKEHQEFIEVFIKSRGNIKEVERALGISYPTVRSKLDAVIEALGYNIKESPDDETGKKRKEILDLLSKGEIDSKEAIKMLREL